MQAWVGLTDDVLHGSYTLACVHVEWSGVQHCSTYEHTFLRVCWTGCMQILFRFAACLTGASAGCQQCMYDRPVHHA